METIYHFPAPATSWFVPPSRSSGRLALSAKPLEQHFPPVHNALAVNCSAGVPPPRGAMAIQASSHRDFETPRSWRSQSAVSTISRQVGVAIGKIGPQERGQVGPPIRQGLSLVRLAEALGVSQPAALAGRPFLAAPGDARATVWRHGRDGRVVRSRPSSQLP